MNHAALTEEYGKICLFLEERKLYLAFHNLRAISARCRNADLAIQLENCQNTYRNLLKYSFGLSDDPEREKVYNRLIRSLYELADDIMEDIIRTGRLLSYYHLQKEVESGLMPEGDTPDEVVDSIAFEREMNEIVHSISGKQGSSGYRGQVQKLFRIIWFSDRLNDNQLAIIGKIIPSKAIPWYDKSLIVSALTLSVFRHFDPGKIMILLDFYQCSEDQVWQRALAGTVLALSHFDRRLPYYPAITDRLKAMQGDKGLVENIELIVIQFIRAKETENLTRHIEKELLPEVRRISSHLEEKLDLGDLIGKEGLAEENPAWETFFKDAPDLYSKFEEFTTLHSEGADVFLGAFAILKRYDFFNEVTNWFIPFYKTNETVIEALQGFKKEMDIAGFTEGLEQTSFLCNSDKYSFCLNLKHMPAMHKPIITELFNMELKALNELKKDDELVNAKSKNKSIFSHYFQDLYRFHKLHPLKHEFTDIFTIPLEIYRSLSFQLLVDDENVVRNVGEFFFSKNFYPSSLAIFLRCDKGEGNPELYEKIAFCYQQGGQFQEALDFYHKAELAGSRRNWVYFKLAYCYRKTGEYNKAVEYYKMAEKEEPENIQVLSLTGQTYMESADYVTALEYLYKAEYAWPENQKIQRMIAWSSFMSGQHDSALRYQQKLLTKAGSRQDYLIAGHLYWVTNNRKMAVDHYLDSIRKADANLEWLTRSLMEDKKYLLGQGISEFDFPLMVDYLQDLL